MWLHMNFCKIEYRSMACMIRVWRVIEMNAAIPFVFWTLWLILRRYYGKYAGEETFFAINIGFYL